MRVREDRVAELVDLPSTHLIAIAAACDIVGGRYVLLGAVQAESVWTVGAFWRCSRPALALTLQAPTRLSFYFLRSTTNPNENETNC